MKMTYAFPRFFCTCILTHDFEFMSVGYRLPEVSAMTLLWVAFHYPLVNRRGLNSWNGRGTCGLYLAPRPSISVPDSLASLHFWVIAYDFTETTGFNNLTALMVGFQPTVPKPGTVERAPAWEPWPVSSPNSANSRASFFTSLKWVTGTESFLKSLKLMKFYDYSMSTTSLSCISWDTAGPGELHPLCSKTE